MIYTIRRRTQPLEIQDDVLLMESGRNKINFHVNVNFTAMETHNIKLYHRYMKI